MKKNLLLLLFALSSTSSAFAITYTWVAGATGNWNDPTKWSPNGIPTAADDVTIAASNAMVTIPAGYAATADFVNITSGVNNKLLIYGDASFTSCTNYGRVEVMVNGTLTLTPGANVTALYNQFEFVNRGTTTMTGTQGSSIGINNIEYASNHGTLNLLNFNIGLYNQKKNFYNQVGAVLNIADASSYGIYNGPTSAASNVQAGIYNRVDATILISDCARALLNDDDEPGTTLNHLIDNLGIITVDGVTNSFFESAVINRGEWMNHSGSTLNITNIAYVALDNNDIFVNELGAAINVTDCGRACIRNHGGSYDYANLTNAGAINLSNTSMEAMLIFDDMTNEHTGNIQISGTVNQGFVKGSRVGYEGTANNYGLIQVNSACLNEGVKTSGLMVNFPCGTINIGNNEFNVSNDTFANFGWLETTYTISNPMTGGYLLNYGGIGDVNNVLPIGTYFQNYRFIVEKTNTYICFGSSLISALYVTSLTGFTVDGWYIDEDATISAGTYNATLNIFTPNASAIGLNTFYVKVTRNSNGCNFIFKKLVAQGVVAPAEYFLDADGDGYGGSTSIETCSPPPNYVSNDSDCNDNDDTIYPGAPELCDGKNNDCDGQTDEGACGLCSDPRVIPGLSYSYSATTNGLPNTYTSAHACSSAWMNGNDYVFEYTPSANMQVNITLFNTGVPAGTTTYGHAFFVLDDCPDAPGANCLASQTSNSSSNNALQLNNAPVMAGQTYYLVISSRLAFHPWFNFTLLIQEVPLPVEIIDFQVSKPYENYALLWWKSGIEQQFSHFTVERSADGHNWQSRGSVLAKGSQQQYEWLDDLTGFAHNGTAFYRLAMTDNDGRVAYSDIRSLSLDKSGLPAVFPNPVEDVLHIIWPDRPEDATLTWQLINAQGAVQTLPMQASQLDLTAQPAGVYMVQVLVDSQPVWRQKIIRTRD